MSGNKSDRSVSPAATSEESRRDLLVRQHRALYGNDSPAFFPPTNFGDDSPRPDGQQVVTTSTTTAGIRLPSPFGLGQSSQEGGAVQPSLQSPPRANSTSSPASGGGGGKPVYGNFEGGGEQPITSTSSPGADSHSSFQTSTKSGGVGPIGSRPFHQIGGVKRSTPPLTSPLSFGFSADPGPGPGVGSEQFPAVSSAAPNVHANRASIDGSAAAGLAWGSASGVWGPKNGLGVQASVWG